MRQSNELAQNESNQRSARITSSPHNVQVLEERASLEIGAIPATRRCFRETSLIVQAFHLSLFAGGAHLKRLLAAAGQRFLGSVVWTAGALFALSIVAVPQPR